jgi:hypothetical protein
MNASWLLTFANQKLLFHPHVNLCHFLIKCGAAICQAKQWCCHLSSKTVATNVILTESVQGLNGCNGYSHNKMSGDKK